MAFLSQALRLGYLLSPHSAFQGHAAHTTGWSAMLSPNGSSDTCISDGVFHIPMPCFHGAPPPGHSVRPARAAVGETGYGAPVHRHPSPSRAAPAHPIGRAFPSTAPVACDTGPPPAHDTPDVCVRPTPTLWEGTTGSRARHDRRPTHTPCTPPPDSCRPSPGGHTIAASPLPSGYPAWGSCWDQRR